MSAAMPLPEDADAERSIRDVAVIGAGTAGREFAFLCASTGYQVVLEDVMPAKLRRAEQDFAERASQLSTGSLRMALTVEDAVRSADVAVDFVPDELESKLEIFSMIDRMAPPRTALVTPTEVLSITDLSSCTYRPDRCFSIRGPLGAHSAEVTRLIVPATASHWMLHAVVAFLRGAGITPVMELDADAPMLTRNYL